MPLAGRRGPASWLHYSAVNLLQMGSSCPPPWPAATSPTVWMARKWGLAAGRIPECSLCWRRTRVEGETLLCMREIMLAPKPIIPKLKKKKKDFSTKLCFYLWILNGRLFTELSWLQKPGQLKQYAGSSPPSNQKLLAQRSLNRGTNLLGDVFQGTPSNGLNVNPPAGEWHFGKWRP